MQVLMLEFLDNPILRFTDKRKTLFIDKKLVDHSLNNSTSIISNSPSFFINLIIQICMHENELEST